MLPPRYILKLVSQFKDQVELITNFAKVTKLIALAKNLLKHGLEIVNRSSTYVAECTHTYSVTITKQTPAK